MHPHRLKLSAIVADELREGIVSRRWEKWLPQERVLAEELRTSRSTLRKSLALLKEEGLIEPLHGTGIRVISDRVVRKTKKAQGRVLLLTPGGVDDPRPLMGLSIDVFMQQLGKEDYDLRTLESAASYGEHPERMLAKTVEHHAADCWILYLSSRPMQRWFQEQRIPAVIMGSSYGGIDLPFVDIDHRALCRHAASTLIQAGHRRIVHLTRAKSRGGDLLGEEGFNDAVAAASRHHSDVSAQEVHHQGTVSDVLAQVRRLLRQDQPPTAMLVSQAAYYLTVLSELGRQRLRVPEDISLITGIDKPFFSYLHPQPASYSVNQTQFIRKLFNVTMAVLRGVRPSPRANWLLPRYFAGGSLRRLEDPVKPRSFGLG